jgi:hypothetical protein
MLVIKSRDCFRSYSFRLLHLVVANQYKKDRKLFEKTARHWANVYANGKEKFLFVKRIQRIFFV